MQTTPREALAVEFRPEPIDTSAVLLPPDLLALTELLARNVHDHRAGAIETLKAILALGYRIEPPPGSPPAAAPLDEQTARVLHALRGPAARDFPTLLALWAGRQPQQWRETSELYETLGRCFV